MTGSRFVALSAVALAMALAGCSSTVPYPMAPSKVAQRSLGMTDEYGDVANEPWDGPVALAFCYNDRFNTPEDLFAEARLACPKGEISYYGSDVLWTPCSLFQPARATFVCTPTPAADSPAAQ